MTDQGIDPLVRMSCSACRRGEPTVTDAEIARFHLQIPDWEVVEVAGVRRLRRVSRSTTSGSRWRSRTGWAPWRRGKPITLRC